jgi:hypothetical protein
MAEEAKKEHRSVDESEAKAALLQKQNESLVAGVQKVSPQLQLSRGSECLVQVELSGEAPKQFGATRCCRFRPQRVNTNKGGVGARILLELQPGSIVSASLVQGARDGKALVALRLCFICS